MNSNNLYFYLLIITLVCILCAIIIFSHILCKSKKVEQEPTIIYIKTKQPEFDKI